MLLMRSCSGRGQSPSRDIESSIEEARWVSGGNWMTVARRPLLHKPSSRQRAPTAATALLSIPCPPSCSCPPSTVPHQRACVGASFTRECEYLPPPMTVGQRLACIDCALPIWSVPSTLGELRHRSMSTWRPVRGQWKRIARALAVQEPKLELEQRYRSKPQALPINTPVLSSLPPWSKPYTGPHSPLSTLRS